ncbi:MAG TPA: caspase family protein [Methanotrichaceae archaeon]|nr:caspase family protein [Methanotrichaceae archaeon]
MVKRAVLVGINDYQRVGDLRGCINDIKDMHFTLRSLFRFETRNIRVLTDSRATKANIVTRLEWLTSKAKPGDFLVFHFSGHGSQIRDRDGDELSDGLDEILCPHDMNWDGTFITDDDLNSIFSALPDGVLLEVFLDCCHSGTAMREVEGLTPPPELAAPTPTLNRYLPPPVDIEFRFADEIDLLEQRGFKKGFEKRGTKHNILWAGCMDNQTSADAYIRGDYHGAFTYYLNSHLRREPMISRSRLLEKVRASLRHGGYSQIPQLEVEATKRDRALKREIFGDKEID